MKIITNKNILFFFLLSSFWNTVLGQQYELTNTFTVKDGLPSNHIYDSVEDNNGFLWIGTDNGVSRFDGKRFVNYTTKNGLPSNDVIQINKEKDGTIWVNCYQQPPSYFNEKSNCFVSFENNKIVIENSKSLLAPINNPNGGIYYGFSYGYLFFKNKIFIECRQTKEFPFFINNKKHTLISDENQTINRVKFHYIFNEKKHFVTKFGNKSNKSLSHHIISDNSFYEFYENFFTVFQKTNQPKISFSKTNIQFPYKLKFSKIVPNEIAVITLNGYIIVYDKNTLKIKHQINTQKNANTYYKDSKKTIWIATVDNGLLKYTTSQIKTYNSNLGEKSNLLSIYVGADETIYTGNFKGNVFATNSESTRTFNLNDERACWVRAITLFDGKVLTVSDFGYNINFCKNKPNDLALIKTAIKLNDSILIMGSNQGLCKLNVHKNKYQTIKSPQERIWNLKPINANDFYFVANKGVFKYNLQAETYVQVFANSVLKNDNAHCIETDKKGRIWVATTKGNIYLLDDLKIVFKIENSDQLPESINKLLSVDQKLWIASKTGLYILSGALSNNYNIQKLSKADGLNSEFINDLFLKGDLVYAATSNGFATIPTKKLPNLYSVTPNLISLKVNNKSRNIEDIAQLKTYETSISIDIAANDLTGHFKKFQYQINADSRWVDLEGNILNLILKQGENKIVVRTIDTNNKSSKKSLNLNFNVAVPYYNKMWFWILISVVISGFIFWILNRRKFAKQKQIFQQQLALELQRNKITADLHDEIGSSLSSLQINSAVANQLMIKNPKEAQNILEKIELQSENLADKIGDIIWSMKPGKDEFMTMSIRIKNFANDILGSTNINYKIRIDPKIDELITDITTRKNIVLILKEAVNNVAKYSKATYLDVNLKMIENTIFIEITDNGIGFDVSKTKGNGIGNMQKRVEELKGNFEIITAINRGTTIAIQLENLK
jgi:signal transduction histidine kinase